jgi:hypothetical protein
LIESIKIQKQQLTTDFEKSVLKKEITEGVPAKNVYVITKI